MNALKTECIAVAWRLHDLQKEHDIPEYQIMSTNCFNN